MQPRICFALWPLIAMAAASSAQPVLTRAPETPAAVITQVRTFQGPAAARITPVTPEPSVVFAIATDFLNKEQLQQVKKAILDFYTASKGKVPTKLALLNPGLSGVAGPVKTRAQLVAALHEIAPNDSDTPLNPASPLGFFSTLGETLRPLGGDWSVVVLTGDFPALPAELTPYAGTLLSARAAANRQRFSVWNLGTSTPAFLGAAAVQSAGLVIQNPAEELVAEFDREEPGLIELDWDRPALARGFHLYDAQLLNAAGQVQRTLPCIAQSPGFDLPDLERYAESLAHVAAARAAATCARDSA